MSCLVSEKYNQRGISDFFFIFNPRQSNKWKYNAYLSSAFVDMFFSKVFCLFFTLHLSISFSPFLSLTKNGFVAAGATQPEVRTIQESGALPFYPFP